ncbi:hypothetical protein EJB05_06038, partial [Eragrostis curvula]
MAVVGVLTPSSSFSPLRLFVSFRCVVLLCHLHRATSPAAVRTLRRPCSAQTELCLPCQVRSRDGNKPRQPSLPASSSPARRPVTRATTSPACLPNFRPFTERRPSSLLSGPFAEPEAPWPSSSTSGRDRGGRVAIIVPDPSWLQPSVRPSPPLSFPPRWIFRCWWWQLRPEEIDHDCFIADGMTAWLLIRGILSLLLSIHIFPGVLHELAVDAVLRDVTDLVEVATNDGNDSQGLDVSFSCPYLRWEPRVRIDYCIPQASH